jgi:hypothetical protein
MNDAGLLGSETLFAAVCGGKAGHVKDGIFCERKEWD